MRHALLHFLKNIFRYHWPLLGAAALLGALLLKNPFSERTLIPNFDPFPDTFHYLTPPRCLLQGRGWRLCRPMYEGIKPDVPPLYSLLMVPFLVINNDPRMFYFLNVLLAGGSLIFLYLLIRAFTKQQLIIAFTLFLYTTNYFIYWYPTLAMAENAVLFLLMAALFVGVTALKSFKPSLIGLLIILAATFYITKPAFVPLTLVFLGWALVALLIHRQKIPPHLQKLLFFVGGSFFVFFCITNAHNIEWVFTSLFEKQQPGESGLQSRWFGLVFWKKHILLYIQALFGKRIPFLWDQTPMLNWWVGAGGLLGLIILVVKSKTRWVGLLLLGALWGQIIFMASFYALDGRYIYHAIPILLLGFAILLDTVRQLTDRRHKAIFLGLVLVVGGYYFLSQAVILKKQIMLNLKYAEQPWWYMSVKKLDAFLSSQPEPTMGKRYLIVAHPPFLFDYYAAGEYELLPLTPLQDFRERSRTAIWGPFDYSDYIALYETLLKDGHTLYLTNYGLGNDKGYHTDFKHIQDSFHVVLLESGCYELCNVYSVELIDEKN